VGAPKYDNDPSAKVRPEQGLLRLRKTFGLYANIRPIATYKVLYPYSPLREERIQGVDFVVYRELTGGAYFGAKGRTPENNGAYDRIEYNAEEVDRIAILAFQAAQQRSKKLCLVDKANVLETSRLWRERVQKIAADYPEVTLSTMFVDNAAMQIILNPAQFDVMLTENMFGDILTDEASVITGSIGLLPSASIGDSIGMFEPIHGSYPQAAGKNIANPFGTILSAAMMLDHFELPHAAETVRQAVLKALDEGKVSIDINKDNYLGTQELGDLIAQYVLA
jgi:3-isopropylmalate dehydrogenase